MADLKEAKQKAEEGEQKAEEGEQKAEERTKKLISSVTNRDTRQWQTFILALIIIAAYVVFFAWIISTSPTTKDTLGNNVIDYSGMTTLTGTFGIIAAAVVGYYFGTRNLKQATDIAESATGVAKQAQGEVEVKKAEVEEEAKDHVDNMEKGKDIYVNLGKVLAELAANKSKPVSEIADIDPLITTVSNRVDEIDSMLEKKKERIKAIESSKL